MPGRFNRLEFAQPPAQAAATRSIVGNEVRTAPDEVRAAIDHARSGRHEDALRHYTRALGYDRAVIPAWVGQVQMLVELGEHREARLWSDKALELFRNNGDLLAARSRACLRMGDRSAALACSDASLQSPGSSAARWQARAEFMIVENRDRARDCFEKSLAEPDADWFDRTAIARIYVFHGLHAAALEYALAGAHMRPSHAFGWYVLGQCQQEMGLRDQALASFARSLELSPSANPARTAADRALDESSAGALWRRLKGAFRK